ncbi:MAG: zinc ribbon domain-containing protein [Thermoflexaceae bacterium]|nr:zinc ribbon domain-containing protein [Thermoflexaceae bacterium]
MSDQLNCPNCGATLAPGARFCGACGQGVPEQVVPQCARCGNLLRPGAGFCPACGASVESAAHPSAPPVSGPAAAACASCGAELAPAAKFCRVCGAPRGGEAPGWQGWTPAAQAPARKQNAAIWVAGGVLLVAALAALAFFFLKGGGDDDDGTPADSGSKAPARTVTTESGKVLSAAEVELGDMMIGLAEKTFKVTYEIKGGDEVSGTALDAKLTLVSAPPRMALTFDAGPKGLDLAGLFGGEESGLEVTEGSGVLEAFTFIYDGEKTSFLCVKMVDEEGQCQQSEAEPEEGEEQFNLENTLSDVVNTGSEDEAAELVEIKGQKIAGRDARCFEMKRKEETEENKSDIEVTFCVDKQEGLPLLLEGKGTGEGTIDTGELLGEDSVDTEGLPGEIAIEGSIKAKSVAFKVSDSDFKPPYKIVESLD